MQQEDYNLIHTLISYGIDVNVNMTMYWKGIQLSLLEFLTHYGSDFEFIMFLLDNIVDIHGLSLVHLLQNER